MAKFILWIFVLIYSSYKLFDMTDTYARQRKDSNDVSITVVTPSVSSTDVLDFMPITVKLEELISKRINPRLPFNEVKTIADAISVSSGRYNLDPMLVLGVISAESSGRFWVNNKGCLGLMQVKKTIWDEKLKEKGFINDDGDYFRINTAVEAGCYVLAHYMKEAKGNVDKALALYSGGAGSRYMQRAKAYID